MRLVSLLFCCLFLNTAQTFAAEHSLASQMSYHADQDAHLGYGVFYQYKFLENFEFEAKYSESGDLKVFDDKNTLSGDFGSLSLGINFIKQRNQDLSLKFGFGLNLVTASSNHILIETNALAPYFQISANYKLTNQLSVNLGQTSQFHQDNIGTNHSLFISVNWLFGQHPADIPFKKVTTKRSVRDVKHLPQLALNDLKINTTAKPRTLWYVQIGAYQQQKNADQKSSVLQASHALALTTKLHKGLFRIVSQPFSDRKSAEEYLIYLKYHYDINGFINKF
jgi:hypothetical protein